MNTICHIFLLNCCVTYQLAYSTETAVTSGGKVSNYRNNSVVAVRKLNKILVMPSEEWNKDRA
jgi:hypothetical protein